MKLIFLSFVIVCIFSITPQTVDAKDKPLPYTQPRIELKADKIQVSWYNTTPKTWTVSYRYERCSTKLCIEAIKIVWRKHIGIGNVRINLKRGIQYQISSSS